MELEEMKNAWTALDNRLKENESLKAKIIKEMLETKANKSMNRLMLSEILGLAVCLLIMPVTAYLYNWRGGQLITWDILIIFSGIFCALYVVWGSFKISQLMKIDFTKEVSNNIYYINKFDILMKYERMAMTYVGGPLFAILAILCYAQAKVGIHLWVFMTCLLFLATIISYWSYKRFYPKNMTSLKKSMEELEELKEE